MPLTLVLGGARSGKSTHARLAAEREAERRAGRRVMIATAEAFDVEMAERIARHRDERSRLWTTIEAPIDICAAIDHLEPQDVAVVDCLTLWLNNLMHYEKSLAPAFDALLSVVSARARGARGCALFLVSNEVGHGLAPDNALARRFRDEAGLLHQRLAATADTVVFVTAGLVQTLKPERRPRLR